MKDDLISREAAIDALAKEMPRLTTPDGSGQFDREIQIADEAFVDCMTIINELPSADAVPVVRCKDCKYNRNPPSAGNALCDNFYGMTDQNGFCHFGERRIDG